MVAFRPGMSVSLRSVKKEVGRMKKIRVAIAGVGNCASSLIQGIHYARA